ncbi:CapA family protein [Ciceribacter sp. RN22]|uniref:CapA family protein n=1 Tax=Ciceribacter sp. RN22 TaxID=2954932 RepID=UPI002092E469|nr:CapA family protein [Ciceribacter sp. RN22]MCO6180977.1 CapA family protein [Ciceribacter sp. RN22]
MAKSVRSSGKTYSATIAWGGDVNIGRRLHGARGGNYADALAGLAPLKEADLSIVNLECVVATCGEQGLDKGERSSYYYRARPEMLATLIDGGIDLVATANNHSGDYGPEALLEQADWLDRAGIAHAGSGANLEQALRPAIRRAGHFNVAVFSIDATQASFAATADRPGHAYLPLSNPAAWRETLAPLIRQARQSAHLVLVAVHWGGNHEAVPSEGERQAGHALIDAGADAVLGTSAHRLQGLEIYKDRPIIHDAGDLLFDAYQRETNDTGVFVLDVDASGVRRVTFHPAHIGYCATTLLAGPDALAAARNFADLSAYFDTPLDLSPDGTCGIALAPPRRKLASLASAPATRYDLDALQRPASPRPEWIAERVPDECRLETPVTLGPLELLGARLTPGLLDRRGLFFVESYWRLSEPTEKNWRLDFLAHPDKAAGLPDWGQSCDHDPCDWMWPTSRWEAGTIYRDFYSLRPSQIRRWKDASVQLSVSVKCEGEQSERVRLPVFAKFALGRQEALSLLIANVPSYKTCTDAEIAANAPDESKGNWTAQQLETITGGKWLVPPPPGWHMRSVIYKGAGIDPKDAERPAVYAAMDMRTAARHELWGDLDQKPDWDTHDRLPVIQKQIDGAMVIRPVEGLAPSLPVFQVDDPMQAVMELGVAGRQRLAGRVVAVTGSSGKTSLTNMLVQSMQVDKKVATNRANYNSRTGILFLFANIAPSTDVVVLEAAVSAINAPGFRNIKLVRPDIAVITNIAPSHLPRGKTLKFVAQRKANLFEGVPEGGWAVIYRETEYFDYLCERARKRGLNLMTYGTGADCDIRLETYDPATNTVTATLGDGKQLRYEIAADGMHMALNSLACLCVRKILGFELAPFLPALKNFTPSAGRGQTRKLDYRGKAVTLIDESYNANPVSMRAALDLVRLKQEPGARDVLVLGDMLELGDDDKRYHVALAPQIRELQPDRVLLCGSRMQHLWKELQADPAAPVKGSWYADAPGLMRELDRWVEDGDRILVKASNSIGLGALVKEMTKESDARPGVPSIISRPIGAHVGYAVFNHNRRELLVQSPGREPFVPGTLQKLMTLMVVLDLVRAEGGDPADLVHLIPAAPAGAAAPLFAPGSLVSVETLARAVIVAGSNEAVKHLVEWTGFTSADFVRIMMTKSVEIGLRDALWTTPTGLGATARISVADTVALTSEIVESYPELLEWASRPDFESGDRRLRNTNGLIGTVDGVDGLRAGELKGSGANLVATLRRGGERWSVIVLGASGMPECFSTARTLIARDLAKAS